MAIYYFLLEMPSLMFSIFPVSSTVEQYIQQVLSGPSGKSLTTNELMKLVNNQCGISYFNDIASFQAYAIDLYINMEKKKIHKWVDTKTVRKCDLALQQVIGFEYMPNALIGKLVWKYASERGLVNGAMCILDERLKCIFGSDKDRVNPVLHSYNTHAESMVVADVPNGPWSKTLAYLQQIDKTKEYELLLKTTHSNVLKCDLKLKSFLNLSYCTMDCALDMIKQYVISKKLVKNDNLLHPDKRMTALGCVVGPFEAVVDLLKSLLNKFNNKDLPMMDIYQIAQFLEHYTSHVVPFHSKFSSSLLFQTSPTHPTHIKEPRKKNHTRKLCTWDALTAYITNYKFLDRAQVLKLVWVYIKANCNKTSSKDFTANDVMLQWGLSESFLTKDVMRVLNFHCVDNCPDLINIPENEMAKSIEYLMGIDKEVVIKQIKTPVRLPRQQPHPLQLLLQSPSPQRCDLGVMEEEEEEQELEEFAELLGEE